MDNWKYDEEEDEVEVIDDMKKINYDNLSLEKKESIEIKFNKSRSFVINGIIGFAIEFFTIDFCFLDVIERDENWFKYFLIAAISVFVFNIIVMIGFTLIINIKADKLTLKGKNNAIDLRYCIPLLLIPADCVIYAICFRSLIVIVAAIFMSIVVTLTLLIAYKIGKARGTIPWD